MEAIYIPGLTKAPEQKEDLVIEEFLPGLETLMPVRGHLQVKHQGTYLDVTTQAETIVTLTCDRCLKQYNHRLSVKTSELIWLDAAAEQPDNGPLERETSLEELVETLSPNGYFQPDVWLYEQFCLALPLRKLCDNNCTGIDNSSDPATSAPSDSRWNALANLKKQLPS